METSDAPAPDRSRRVYVWWGVGFAFLALLGLFCLLVVRPVAEVHSALRDDKAPPPSCLIERAEAGPIIAALGGQAQAARKLDLYLRMRMSKWALRRYGSGGEAESAAILLGHCGRPGLQRIVAMLESSDYHLEWCGNLGLCGFFQSHDCYEIRRDPEHRKKALEGLDPETRQLAERALRALERVLLRSWSSVAE